MNTQMEGIWKEANGNWTQFLNSTFDGVFVGYTGKAFATFRFQPSRINSWIDGKI